MSLKADPTLDVCHSVGSAYGNSSHTNGLDTTSAQEKCHIKISHRLNQHQIVVIVLFVFKENEVP
jgi:hypothetical protein